MQKDVAKTIFRAAGIPTPGGKLVPRLAAAKEHVLERPYVLKPVNEGSSVGVFIVTKEHEHPPQELTRPDWEFGETLLAEPFIRGKELTCAVMGDKALDVIEVVPTARPSTTMRPNTHRAVPNTCCRPRFYQLFTKRSED